MRSAAKTSVTISPRAALDTRQLTPLLVLLSGLLLGCGQKGSLSLPAAAAPAAPAASAPKQ